MDKILDTLNKADEGLERLKSGCGWVFLNLAWIVLIGIAVYSGRNSWELKQGGTSTSGTVVSFHESEATHESGVTWAPIVKYEVDGKAYTYTSSTSSDPPAYDVGDKVTLLYRAGDPEDAQIDSWSSLWLLPTMLGAGGVALAIVSIVWMVTSLRRRREARNARQVEA